MTSLDGKKVAETEITPQVGGQDQEEARRWFKQQVPYQNYAGFSQEFDEEIRQFVETRKTSFRNRMQVVHQRWAFNWAMANGEGQTQEREDDVAMPETQKLLNSKVAHMEQSLFSVDPMLEVEGVREDMGRLRSVVISAYLRRMLELANHRDYFGPAAKDAQLCNYSVIKVVWDKRFADVIHRKTEYRYGKEGQDPYWHDERWMQRNKVVADSAKLELVDPFWLILDLEAGRTEDLAYIGEESEPFIHVLEQQAELGLYPKKQIERVKKAKRTEAKQDHSVGTGANIVDQFRQARQLAIQTGVVDMQTNAGDQKGAQRVRVIELWAWYDFGEGREGVVDPDGKIIKGTHQIVVTIAEGIVLQFRLNPWDRKFVPYAVAIPNRNGHEMVAPAPFDQVVVMNAQYDRFQSSVLRHLDLSIAPFIVTGTEADISEPLTDIQAGAILKIPGDFKEVNIKDLPSSVQFFYSFYRREMEELAGKLRVHETPVGTATEVERKLQEQAMLLDRETRVQAEQWRQVALIIYKMAGQFATQGQQFAVVGKMQSVLGKTWTMPPNWLQEEIDLRFLGVESMYTLGQRSAGLTQWTNQFLPLRAEMPEVNWTNIARKSFELMVGRHDMNEIFPDPEPAWMQWSQDEENALLRMGQKVPVSKHDNHEEHVQKTLQALQQVQADPGTPPHVLEAFTRHLDLHFEAIEKEAAIQQAQMREAEQRGQLMGAAGGIPGVDRPGAAGGLEPATQPTGLTPGPQQARTVARAGREGSGVSETQANDAQ